MFVILVIAIGAWMMILPVIKAVTLDDIIMGLGVLTIFLGIFGWLLARHIDKE